MMGRVYIGGGGGVACSIGVVCMVGSGCLCESE